MDFCTPPLLAHPGRAAISALHFGQDAGKLQRNSWPLMNADR